MKCKKLRKIYSKYIDGQLSKRENRSVEEHIRDCPNCAAEVNSLEKMRSLLQTSAQVEVSDEYWDTYWTRLEKKLPDEPSPVTLASRMSGVFADLLQQPAVLGRVAIYVLLLAFVLYTTSDRHTITPSIEAPARTLARDTKEDAPALSAGTSYEGIAAKEKVQEEAYFYARGPADNERAGLADKDANGVEKHAVVGDELAAKLALSKVEEPLSENSEELGQLAPAKPEVITEGWLRAAPAGEDAGKTEMDLRDDLQDGYVLAEQQFRAGEYDLAITNYQNFVTANTVANVQDERTLKAVFQIGEANYQMGNYSDALANFAAVTDPEEVEEEPKGVTKSLAETEQRRLSMGRSKQAETQSLTSSAPRAQAERKAGARARRAPEPQRGVKRERDRQWQDDAIPETLEGLISRAIFRQAESYEHLKRYEEALAAYTRYVEKYPQGEYVSQAREKITQKRADSQKAAQEKAKEGKAGKREKNE